MCCWSATLESTNFLTARLNNCLGYLSFKNTVLSRSHSCELNLSRDRLIELLDAATKNQLFQFKGNLYEQADGVTMRSPLGPLLANVFMCSVEDILDQDGKLPSCYRRYVDDTFTIMPDIASARVLLSTLNQCHPSAKFTMEVEQNSSLPFICVELLNLAPRIKTKGLLLHYQSHMDNWYEHSLITTMLDRAYCISSDWSYFSQEKKRRLLALIFTCLCFKKSFLINV